MVIKRATLLGILLVLGLLLPLGASAKTQTILGSVMITGVSPTDIVGVAVIHNPGFEKTISQQIPPLTFPVFVDVDEDDVSGAVLNKRFDTVVTLTNATAGPLDDITLTLLDASGTTALASTTIDLAANASAAVFLSDLLL